MVGNRSYVAWTRRGRVLIAAIVVVVASTGFVIAQQQSGEKFESVALRHLSPNEAAQRIENAYGGAVEVVADGSKGRVLISGKPTSVASARRFLQKLDKPSSVAESPAPQTQQVDRSESQRRDVVSYRVRPDDLRPLADFIRSKYRLDSDVTVATDERLSQILVVSNQVTQQEIASLMREQGYRSTEEREHVAAEKLATAMNNELRITESHELKNINWAEFESAVVKTWGNRLSVESHRNGELLSVQLPTPRGVRASMNIDRPNNRLVFDGPRSVVDAWSRVVKSIDVPREKQSGDTQWVAVENSKLNKIKRAVSYLRLASSSRVGEGQVRQAIPVTTNAAQDLEADPLNPGQGQGQDPNNQDGETPQIPGQDEGQGDEGQGGDNQAGLIGNVQIEFIPELDLVLIKGNPEDVAQVRAIINRLQDSTADTLPVVEVYPLQHVDSVAIQTIVQQVYDAVLATRQQPVSITALLKPNALLLVGRQESIDSVKEFLKQLDTPVDPSTEFKIFHLKNMSSVDAKARIDEHFSGIVQQGLGGGGTNQITDDIRVGLANRVRATADYRSNTVIVSASPRDLEEITRFIEGIDVVDIDGAVDEVRVFYLKNALAEELAPVLQDVMNGQLQGAGVGAGAQGQGGQVGTGLNQTNQLSRLRSSQLELVTIDPEGQMRRTRGGFGYDVRVTADLNSNSVTVKGPKENMEFVEKLIKQLDRLPDAETVLKVYTIQNGDASKLLELLQALFQPATQGNINLPPQSGTLGDSSTLVSLSFAIDTRTNSLIVSGSEADLRVVESILIRLDEDEFQDRLTIVTRLHNAQAEAVATAIQGWLDGRDELNSNEDLFSIYQQYDRTIIVVAEPNSNSLIVSASRAAMPEIDAVIESLDRRPPMVAVQVMLASVSLGDQEEFGIEMGLQDSLLFDRGASNIGFNFVQSGIGNDPASYAATREPLLSQGINLLNVGRTNSTLGFGGLVLSASNESVSLLLRALKRRNRLQVLSRPQVMTVENISASIQIGQSVPYITASNITAFGQQNTVEFRDVGVLLTVVPRVSPDGMMVLNVSATKSELDSEEEGVPISINQNGDVIRAPIINIITSSSTLMARTGQTIILGGLIESSEADVMRGVPVLSDIPAVGQLFRYDATVKERDELLIIMTPYLIENEGDLDMYQQPEYGRMSWCLADVADVHGPIGYSEFNGFMEVNGPTTIYPDADPTGSQGLNSLEGFPPQQIQSLPGESGGQPEPPMMIDPQGGSLNSPVLPPFDPRPVQQAIGTAVGSQSVEPIPTVPVRQRITSPDQMETPIVRPADYVPNDQNGGRFGTYDGMVRPTAGQRPVSNSPPMLQHSSADYPHH